MVGGTEQKEKDVGVLGLIAVAELIMSAAETGVFIKQSRKLLSRILHGKVKLIAVVDNVRFIHIGTDGNRARQVKEVILDDFFSDKLLNCLILCKHKALAFLVAGKKAVICDCHRKLHRFRQF